MSFSWRHSRTSLNNLTQLPSNFDSEQQLLTKQQNTIVSLPSSSQRALAPPSPNYLKYSKVWEEDWSRQTENWTNKRIAQCIFSLRNYNTRKILCAASDWNFRGTSNTNQTHFKKMWRQGKKTVVTKLPILKGSTITKIFQRRIFERECDENRETERLFPENYYSWRMTIPRELLFPDNYYSSRMTVPWWEKLMNAIPRTRLRLNNACQHIYAPRKVAINRKVSPTAGK